MSRRWSPMLLVLAMTATGVSAHAGTPDAVQRQLAQLAARSDGVLGACIARASAVD